jgi:hypothetical protein
MLKLLKKLWDKIAAIFGIAKKAVGEIGDEITGDKTTGDE